jgi:uncharacterized protein
MAEVSPFKPCPICKKLSDVRFHPFCSNRCKEVDLSRWFKGSYAIPVAEPEENDD